MSEQSDLELVLLSQQGDKAAFSQLVFRYQPMAYRLAIRMISDRDLAQELVQDALLQAYLSLEKLKDPTRFKSWLYGIVLNVCRSDLRRRKIVCFSFEAIVEDLIDKTPTIAQNSDPQLVAEQEELRTTLLEAMDALSPKNRSAIVLFYQEQYSLQEVANRLNISVSAVKGRLHKSRHQLREQLSPHQIQPDLFQEIKPMAQTSSAQTVPEYICSFCSKGKEDVEMLIAGPIFKTVRICICTECVEICNQLIRGEIPRLTSEEAEKLKNEEAERLSNSAKSID